jgi:hypothetical protein
MYRTLWAFVALLLASISAGAQITMVHVTTCGPQTFPATACTIPASGAGNIIVVGIQLGAGVNTNTTISRVADSAGNVYTEAGAARSFDTGAQTVGDIWYTRNSISGATAITITPSSNVSAAYAVIWEFAGADPNAPFDASGVLNSQAATSSVSGASITTSGASEAIVSLGIVATNVSGISGGNSFTNDSTLAGNGWAHLFTSASGTYAAAWTQNPAGTYGSSTAAFKAASTGASACDLAPPYGTIDSADVQAAVNMALGITPCTANIAGSGVCNVVVVQRVVNASLPGGVCVTGYGAIPHSAILNWTASNSQNLTNYKVYRGTTSGGPYTLLSILGLATTYTDYTVAAGQTYYYVTTAVDNTGAESAYSNQASASVPTP